MTLTLLTLFISMCLSGYFAYLICSYTAWYYFFTAFLFVIPTWLVIFLIWVLILFIWGLFIKKNKEYNYSSLYYFILRNTDTWVMNLLRIFVKKKNFESIPKEKCLFIINHNSNFDPMLMIEAISDAPLICVTKPENFKFPIAGPFIRRCGYIDINRDDPRKAIKAINKASDVLSSNIGHVCICPEGTRNKTNQPILPFHPGSFKIATKAECPIVVIDVKNTKAIKKNMPFKHTIVEMNVVAVLTKDDYQDKSTQEIAEYCQNKILEDFVK